MTLANRGYSRGTLEGKAERSQNEGRRYAEFLGSLGEQGYQPRQGASQARSELPPRCQASFEGSSCVKPVKARGIGLSLGKIVESEEQQ